MPRLLTGILCLLLAGWSFARRRAGEHPGHQHARHSVADLRYRHSRTGQAVPHRPAAAPGARLAHLLAEPRRCRRAARTGPDAADGAKAGPIAWPVPQRIAEGSLMTYAYTGDLLLPVTITPTARAAPSIKAHAEWLVCRDICVPEDADFQLDLPRRRRRTFARRRHCSRRPSGGCRARRPGSAVAGQRRYAVGAGAGADPGHRGRCVVHTRRTRHHPRQCRSAADRLARRLHACAASGQGVPPAGRRYPAFCRCATAAGMETDVALHAQPGTVPPPPPDDARCSGCWCWHSLAA